MSDDWHYLMDEALLASVENLGSLSANAHNSGAARSLLFKFCTFIYLNIVQSTVCETVTRLERLVVSSSVNS